MAHQRQFFIHITDTHIKAPSNKPFLNLNPEAKLRSIFAAVKQLSVQPICFVISGDLTHEGVLEDYEHYKTVIAEEAAAFDVPVLVALGNHDHRAPFREGYLGEAADESPYHYSQWFGDLRIIVLDSKLPGKTEGFLDEAQLAWLKGELATPAAAGTVIVVHHPPAPNSHPLLVDHGLTNADQLAAAITGSDVIGILSGHIHFNSLSLFHGVLCAAGMGAAFNLDPTTPSSMRFIDSAGFNLVMVEDRKLVVQPMPMPGEQTEVYHWHIGDSLGSVTADSESVPEELH